MQSNYVKKLVSKLSDTFAEQPEYLQAIEELIAFSELDPALVESCEQYNVLARILQPDRVISFNVVWQNDQGEVQVNRGWRVQHSNLIGPYKGGLRFHPDVNESVLKFLALEQTFKNALTGLPIGGAKGGANFAPKGKSTNEIMRFCQAFMGELYRYIGPNTDIPAGDINVGPREIGYLFGAYRRIKNKFSGALTGKDVGFGGSHVRIESTGFGVIYFVEEVLADKEQSLDNLTLILSGAGNVALNTAKKAIEQGAKVLTLSNSSGYLLATKGLRAALIDELLAQKAKPDLSQIANGADIKWYSDKKPWEVDADIAIPCATQNELDINDAKKLVKNGVLFVFEGANMPCTSEAIHYFKKHKISFLPAKAVNAGGVAMSTFEMGQNANFYPESFEKMDEKLALTMKKIHQHCVQTNTQNYLVGANSFALNRLVKAALAQGI